ncbi:MAG: hypothetical protein OEV44_13840 [Spirochaetota bacterium]|nr:hypothetical protein [Spirochaetota bacterium]
MNNSDEQSISNFVDKLEDEICHRTDIDDFEKFFIALAKELNKRYGEMAKIVKSAGIPDIVWGSTTAVNDDLSKKYLATLAQYINDKKGIKMKPLK